MVGGTAAEITTATGLILPKFQSKIVHAIPIEVWTPYNRTSSSFIYWTTYAINGLCGFSAGNLMICTDTILNGIIIAASAQIELLSHRLTSLPDYLTKIQERKCDENEKTLIDQSVCHHLFIYRLFTRVFKIFCGL